MKIQRQFETKRATALREAAQIDTLIRGLNDAVRKLDADIAIEEERAGISDPANAHYPILARVFAVRRTNLEATIATFEQRLATLRQIFPEIADTAA
jgi:flagellar protein FliJ